MNITSMVTRYSSILDRVNGFTAGLLAVAFFPFLSAILVLMLGHNTALERIVAPAE